MSTSCRSFIPADPGVVVTILLLRLQVRVPAEQVHSVHGVLGDENGLREEIDWR